MTSPHVPPAVSPARGSGHSDTHRIAAGILLVVFLLGLAGFSSPADAQVTIPPRKDRAVHDFANVVQREDALAIETIAREVWGRAKVAIVVVTLTSLEGEAIEDVSLRWGREWGIGGKGESRGILMLVSVGDRKARIENGYGVEGYLPDGLVGRLLDQEAIPYFKRGDYSVGIRRTVEQVALLTAKEYGFELTGKIQPRVPRKLVDGGALLLLLVLLILFLGGGLPSLLWWGLLGGRKKRRGGRRGPPWFLGGGGFGGGGFGGGSFGGGGGFGGFGGGSFGGGGASRGW